MTPSRIRTSEGLQFINQWQASGLNQKAFCESKGIGYARFHYWYGIYRREQKPTSCFMPIQVSAAPDSIVLRGENGIQLEMTVSATSAIFVKQLLTV